MLLHGFLPNLKLNKLKLNSASWTSKPELMQTLSLFFNECIFELKPAAQPFSNFSERSTFLASTIFCLSG